MISQTSAGRGSDRTDHRPSHAFAESHFFVHAFGNFQQIADLMSRREHQDIGFCIGDSIDIREQRRRVFRQSPFVNFQRRYFRSPSFKPSDEARIRCAVLLQNDTLCRDRAETIDGAQNFSPRVRCGDAMRRRNVYLLHSSNRFRTSCHSNDVSQRIEKSFHRDAFLDGREQMIESDSRHDDDHFDLAGHASIREVNR